MNEMPYIIAIGGANMDITGISNEPVKMQDSNPGQFKLCMGGVMRNIAENLCHLELPVKFLTAIGTDVYGERLRHHCHEIGLDISMSIQSDEYPTSTYISIIDSNGDMVVAINNMDILNLLTQSYFDQIRGEITDADILLLDTNLDVQLIDHILLTYPGIVFMDTVSAKKAIKIKPLLKNIQVLKTNRLEAEVLTGLSITNVDDAYKAVAFLIKKGVSKVFLTMGREGVVFGDHTKIDHYQVNAIKPINETGAGDAFMAGIVYGYARGFSNKEIAKWASAASILTSESDLTNHPDFSVATVQQKLNQLNQC